MKVNKVKSIRGEISIPGDKSISHRSIMLGALAKGTTRVQHFLQSADCLSTISCFKAMGIDIENKDNTVYIYGKGLHGLTKPSTILDCGNSGTTTRLISGILSGQDFDVTLTGDSSIQKRPMKRIIEPLSLMGADISSINGNGCAPLYICGRKLHGINYKSKVASAQVKSSILLAGLYADGETSVTEPYLSRNHSELMLGYFGADVHTKDTTTTIKPAEELFAQDIFVPGDISSAAYFIAAGLIIPNSEVLIKNVGINPTRDGILRVCRDMGADIKIIDERIISGEPVADILVRSGSLKGTVIEGAIIPTLIDELPVIAVMACFADGTTIIKDAAELKVKESNRIAVMVENLSLMGADITETDDGMIIKGGRPLHGAKIDSHMDHRIAMSFTVCGMACDGQTEIPDSECVNISYPEFFSDINSLCTE